MTQFITLRVQYTKNQQHYQEVRLINLSLVTEIKPAQEGEDWCIFHFANSYTLANISFEEAANLLTSNS